MCIVSNAYDHYKPLFPKLVPSKPIKLQPFVINQTVDLSELKELIKEFREAVELAKRLDVLMKQPGCVDPEKARLEQRVAELEQMLTSVRATVGTGVKTNDSP